MGYETTPNPDDLLLLPEVAEITRRSIDTLRWLRHCGKGPRGHRSGRRVYYRRRDVIAWLEEQERQAEDAPRRTPQSAALPRRAPARCDIPICPFSPRSSVVPPLRVSASSEAMGSARCAQAAHTSRSSRVGNTAGRENAS